MMWARSGGVCQYPGCGEVLYLDRNVPKARINLAELAHIIGFSVDGPRGEASTSDDYIDDHENLLFLCRNCHRKIDSSPAEYPVELLRAWKDRHERQVLTAAVLTKGKEVVPIIIRSTQIGARPNLITKDEVREALLLEGYSIAVEPQEIELQNENGRSTDASYWDAQIKGGRIQLRSIRKQLELAHRDTPIAVFARAEMPMLMAVGHMLGNTARLQIFQPNSQRQMWTFRNDGSRPSFAYRLPEMANDGDVALSIELTSTIDEERIRDSLEHPVPIIRLTTPRPSRDLVASRRVIEDFWITAQSCLSDIENAIPRSCAVHVFPSMAASLALVLGAMIQPKASNVFRIYDARGPGARFRPALDLPLADSEPH